MGPWVASKIPSLSPRASPSALGLRDGIFDATLGPIWYYYSTSQCENYGDSLSRIFGKNIVKVMGLLNASY